MSTLSQLRDKKEKEWLKDIAKVAHHIRPTVARLIWWDFFGGRLVPYRWTGLDKYLDFPSEFAMKTGRANVVPYPDQLPKEQLRAALVSCGYSADMAKRRV